MGHLVLTGFMGAGKTTVAGAAARLLGRRLVDTDRELARRLGAEVAEVLELRGEPALRQAEAALCDELGAMQTEELVIATGGGTLIDPARREALDRGGDHVIACLDCDPDELRRRINASGARRPLLGEGEAAAEVIARLLYARRDAYEAIPWHVDTTALTVAEAAERVVALATTTTLVAHAGAARYPVHLGRGLLDQLGPALRAANLDARGARVALVSNPVVAPLYAARARRSLEAAGFACFECSIPDGEQHKTLATVGRLYDELLAGGLERRDLVCALGGGVTGDLAGFAAATALRGVGFVNVPTSLLAMVDACVGGKTGVDLPQGKNLVGAFHQPRLVLVDPALLATLAPRQLRAGLAEVVKHGVLGAPALFEELAGDSADPRRLWGDEATTLIARALRVKLAMVAEDPHEGGRRALLNLGHTVGHALEQLGGFKELLHGEAVAIGLCGATRLARARGLCEASLVERVEATLGRWGLPCRCPPRLTTQAILEAMTHDKKRRHGAIRWALPRDLGDAVLVDDVALDEVREVLVALGASAQKER